MKIKFIAIALICINLSMSASLHIDLDHSNPISKQLLKADAALGLPEVEKKLVYIDMPVIKGRNDVLTRDIFTTTNWGVFKPVEGVVISKGGGDPDIGRRTITADDITKLESLIKLDGIIASDDSAMPEAFIDSKLVSIGSKVAVEYNNRLLELVVTEIHKSRVVLRWEKFMLNVKMPQVD